MAELRTGYVAGVAVRADRRRHGHATAIMEAWERPVRGGNELGDLAAISAGHPVRRSRLAIAAELVLSGDCSMVLL